MEQLLKTFPEIFQEKHLVAESKEKRKIYAYQLKYWNKISKEAEVLHKQQAEAGKEMKKRQEEYEAEVQKTLEEVEGTDEKPREVQLPDNSEFELLFTEEKVKFVQTHYDKLIKPEESPNVLLTAAHNAHSFSAVQALLVYLCKLVHQFYVDESNADLLLRTSKIWVIPVMNPDGYEYFRQI